MAASFAVGLASCGGGSATGSGGGGGDAGAPPLTVIEGAPEPVMKEPDGEAHEVDGYVSAAAGNGPLTALGTTTTVYRMDAAGPVALELVGDEPNLPASTGAVRAMAAYEAGILIAADGGLFFTDGAAVQLSLANDTLGALGITAMSARVVDGEAKLAVIASGKAGEIAAGEMSTWAVDGEAAPAIAVLAQDARIFVSYGHHAYEIDKATKKARALPEGVGYVREIACGSSGCDEGSLIYFASDAGLVERGADGAYRLFPLSAKGAAPVAVETFAIDAAKQRLYAIAGTSVLRVRAGEIPAAVATLTAPTAMPRRMTVDKAGDVWAGEGTSLRRLALGTPLSFVTDVRPILHEYCAGCHANGSQGAPLRDFESYEVAAKEIDAMLTRVQQGSMPPLSYGKKLPKESIQILQDWAVTRAP